MDKRVKSLVQDMLKTAARFAGLDIVREKNSPRLTLLGLRACPVKTVIDIGANRGQFARAARKHFPNARIYCYEPLTRPFTQLEAWAKTQNGRVSAFNMALGATNASAQIHFHIDHDSSSSFLETTKLNIEQHPFMLHQSLASIPVVRLDDALPAPASSLRPEILLKLDVQGYEDRVLAGAPRLLEVISSCIVEINIATLYAKQASFLTITSQLDAAGLRYVGNLAQHYGSGGEVLWLDAVFRRTST